MMSKIKRAFTIAEIVVAMLVLGGIAMILMPVLFHNAQNQINDTALNRTYATFQQTARSVGLLVSKGQIVNTGNPADVFFQALKQTSKTVDRSKNVAYFENYKTNITKSEGENKVADDSYFQANSNNTIVLKNGVFVQSKKVGATDYIIVDTNGLRAPNKVGQDIFFFEVKDVNNTYSVHPAQGSCQDGASDWDANIGCAKNKLKLVR